MGEAWKAWDTRLKRNVTIKLPHSSSLSDIELRRFLREGEAAAQLSHPQLACVHETRNDGGMFYIVATYVEGKNLREHAAARQLRLDEIVELCASIGEALQCGHDEGVVHRDLKPANIIIDPNGLPHIIDFGLAKILDEERDLTLNGELLGTPAYMSPELASGDGANADGRTDVYSLGVILYELLTGRCPFVGNRGSVISQILARDPALPRSLRSSIPRDLETTCLKAMEKPPECRYATPREMAKDLRLYASGLPIRARRAGILEKSWRWICRHPAMAASALLLLAAIVVTCTTIASLRNRNHRLAGFRPVRITTTPSGAKVAIVPINPETNEPDINPAGIIRPAEATPLTTELQAGTYLVEAVLPGGERPDFVEVYRTVLAPSNLPELIVRKNRELGLEPDTCLFGDVAILPQAELIKEMAEILVPQEARKINPLLPSKLYVDVMQTIPVDIQSNEKFRRFLSVTDKGEPCMSYPSANRWAELNQTRLPSSAEYDEIIGAVERGEARSVRTGEAAKMDGLFDNYPEWSTTIQSDSRIGGNRAVRHLLGLHVLKGFTRSNELIHFFSWIDESLLAEPETRSPK
ncbi:MAG TPA: serine/threonine-protein kinase, partial [Pyrinomonadaceae bacterium]|nr:serine/threonine-protein kinase [Pyrinomonadaceae bacterium]